MTITISNLEIIRDAAYGTVLGVLATRGTDDSIVDCNYSLSRGDANLFALSGNRLLTHLEDTACGRHLFCSHPRNCNFYEVFWQRNIHDFGSRSAFASSGTDPPTECRAAFVIGGNGRINFAPPFELDSREDLVERVQELLPLVRRAADELAPHLTSNAFPELARSLTEYRAAIAEEEEVIAWGLVFGLGVMLENAAAATKRKIEDRLLPSLEDASQSALDSLLTLHGPLILATGEGRELQEQADRLRMTREEQLRLRSDAEILALQLLRSPDLIEPEVAETVVQAIQAIGEGRFPERGTVFGFVTTKNVAIVLLSGAALAAFLSAGVALAGPLGGVATTGVAWVGYESLKKSKIFAAATTAVAEKFDQLIQRRRNKIGSKIDLARPVQTVCRRERGRAASDRGQHAAITLDTSVYRLHHPKKRDEGCCNTI
jgi:hypothetical protein